LPHDESAAERCRAPGNLSPHSLRVTTITDLLEQGVPLEDVHRLPGTPIRKPPASMIGATGR
jgi:hypothetical protein